MRYTAFLLLLVFKAIVAIEPVELRVSDKLKNDFTPINKTFYNDPVEINELFTSLRSSSKTYCEMVVKNRRWNKSLAYAHISPSSFPEYSRSCQHCNNSIMAGCWNFFKMNDRRPDRDFKLIKMIYNQKDHDCYSVGFLQPYIMHNEIGCHSITMLDFDWKILDAHWQFIQLLRNRALVNPYTFDMNLAKLKLSYVAFDDDANKPEVAATMKILCKNRQREECRAFISKFQSTVENVNQFRFNLSSLHEADYRNNGSGRIKVIFLSNAIEDIYTSKEDFESLLKHLHYSMNTDEKAVLVHHAGGHLGNQISTLCKDKYRNTVRARPGIYYETYFEEVTISKKKTITTCEALLKQKEKQAAAFESHR